jgi:hypothetical protein
MANESVPQPPRTVSHDRVVAAMELVYGPLPGSAPRPRVSTATDTLSSPSKAGASPPSQIGEQKS